MTGCSNRFFTPFPCFAMRRPRSKESNKTRNRCSRTTPVILFRLIPLFLLLLYGVTLLSMHQKHSQTFHQLRKQDSLIERGEKTLDLHITNESITHEGPTLARISATEAIPRSTVSVRKGISTELSIEQRTIKEQKLREQWEKLSQPLPTQRKPTGRYAHAYVVGGVQPKNPAYRYYLYDIAISTHLSRLAGSHAEVLVFVQMSKETDMEELPTEEQQLLQTMNIRYEYIPKRDDESFYRTMLDKFRIFRHIEYDRVVFMDSDVMLRGNLDYLYHLSMNGTLQPNILLQGKREPAHGGFFMVAPEEGDWERLLHIIHRAEERGATLPYPHWDETVGWGHVIEEGDEWSTLTKVSSRKWGFLGGFCDQGLLWHFVKYVKPATQGFTYMRRLNMIHYERARNGTMLEVGTDKYDLLDALTKNWTCVIQVGNCRPPRSDFVHFTSRKKPWLQGPPDHLLSDLTVEDPRLLWYNTLKVLDEKYKMNVKWKDWFSKRVFPPLGLWPQQEDIENTRYVRWDPNRKILTADML